MNNVEFPGLGLEFVINRVAFKVFGIEVYWYGIIISFAFMLAVFLAMRNSKKFNIEPDHIIDLVLFAAPVGVIFARLFYIIFNWGEFNGDIGKMVNIRTGGIALYGSLIGATLVTYFFTRAKKINFYNLIDLCGPYFLLAQAIGRWGNFVNQEAFGLNTKLPWGMTSEAVVQWLQIIKNNGINVDPALPVHPTFLYESLWNFIGFAILIWYSKRYKFAGEVFSLYMVIYGLGRFWIEGLRTDSLMLGPIRISQWLAILFVMVFSAIIVIKRKNTKINKDEVSSGSDGSSEYSAVLNKIKSEEEG